MVKISLSRNIKQPRDLVKELHGRSRKVPKETTLVILELTAFSITKSLYSP